MRAMGTIKPIKPIGIIGMMWLLLFSLGAQGQIKIGGNVYGGGNRGAVDGSTSVTVKAGDVNRVFGGARMADVGGNAYVNIDGEHATGYTVINYVYGGNDISGTIGTGVLPAEIVGNADDVDISWNTFVHASTKTASDAVYYTQAECDEYNTANSLSSGDEGFRTIADIKTPAVVPEKAYIGQLFAGGNGDYTYTNDLGEPLTDGDGNYIVKSGETVIATKDTPFNTPEVGKSYLDIQGGSIVYAYGGGNKATVTEDAVIHLDNPSEVVNHIFVNPTTLLENKAATEETYVGLGLTDLLTNDRFRYGMGINLGYSKPSSAEFQIGRLFGGNNLAEMKIMPRWNLQDGKVRNLYSGGNRGRMTSPKGLLLEIPETSTIVVDYVYGGCRMADVCPEVDGVYSPVTNASLGGSYKFPDELSARVLVRGGDINNVYGGNDITGSVRGGNAIGIYTSIRGDVYGGGNGAYPYTDNVALRNHDIYGDMFYTTGGGSSVEALNNFRPNAEQVSIRLAGTSAANPTIIGGSVYLGGNCATLKTTKDNPLVELKIGSHVIAENVFLGNNGTEMVEESVLERYAKYVNEDGDVTDNSSGSDQDFSQIDLTQPGDMSTYMEGVALDFLPNLVFDTTPRDPADYLDYSSYIGSLFCGGNVGSMTYPGKNVMNFDHKLVIFDKIVGGCNNANVAAGTYNAAYEGGIKGSAAEQAPGGFMEGDKIKNRLELNLNGIRIQPKRLNDTFVPVEAEDLTGEGKLKEGETYYETNLRSSEFVADGTEVPDAEHTYYKMTSRGTALEWNTAKWSVAEDDFMAIGTDNTADDDDRRFMSGNVYGGCYNSGHVNGNVVININQSLEDRYGIEGLFADVEDDDSYTMKDGGERRSGVILERQGDDVMAVALTVFGGGYGGDTEIWGSTTVNHNNGYVFQIFGGGEEGVIGKKNGSGDYVYNEAYSTTVNLKGNSPGYSEEEEGPELPESEYIYAGGNEGDVCGDTYVNLGNGRVYDAFGGASNADILGATEVHIGRQPNGSGGYKDGFPWVRDNVYGGNDFGGTVKGKKNHSDVTSRAVADAALLESSTFVNYIQGRVDSIFGGNYGDYEYADRIFKDYTNADGTPKGDFHLPSLTYKSFVFFQPVENNGNVVNFIFGGSEGVPGQVNLNNTMQSESYVLIDDIHTKTATRYANTDIYGGGAYAGMGTETALGAGRTMVDLYAGKFNNVYGGSNKEGMIGCTRVNVPAESTVKVNAIFGGGKGYDESALEANPALAARYCDNYVTCVDFQGANAIVEEAIYGGNHNRRIAFDTYVNIGAPVNQSSGYQATVYGAGYGNETVSGRTNVYMDDGSNAYKVFGGGHDGSAFNFESLKYWLGLQYAEDYARVSAGEGATELEVAAAATETAANATAAATAVPAKVKTYGGYLAGFRSYISTHPITLPGSMPSYNDNMWTIDGTDMVDTKAYHNTNVHILEGGNVSGYAYGGGHGSNAVVSGTTYIELLGGNVDRDIYAGGEGGPVMDEYELKTFTATTNAYIEGGMVRNVYGGGYLGHVGKHTKVVAGKEVDADISDDYSSDIPGVANVIIGKKDGTSFIDGIPAIMRNAYGGGEGGSVYGTSNITLNNGYVGYRYKNTGTEDAPIYKYVEELDDKTANAIEGAGNVFGGGYIVNSYVDNTNVKMYDGVVRGSLYGGGEIGPIGRGNTKESLYPAKGVKSGDVRLFKAGKTSVKLYDGHVKRNVFGGGRGIDSWGGDGTLYMDENVVNNLKTTGFFNKGYVFGQTEVDVYGGEVGTEEGVASGYGNVFGGGDIGYVYSAYENASGKLCIGKKTGARYDDGSEGYYYKYEDTDDDGDYEYVTVGTEKVLTEDCKVLIEPWCKVTASAGVDVDTPNESGVLVSKHYAQNEYVPTAALNTLGNKNDTKWASLSTGPTKAEQDKDGILIHNAVFAGGNVSPGSDVVYAATSTVYGNATASIHDVFHRDLITVGTGRVGGLYGDGNLTFVDGYRELNISNYGTDYYSIKTEITYDQYEDLPDREAAYYEIRYRCMTTCRDKDGKTYAPGSTITADELRTVFDGTTVYSRTQVIEDDKPKVDANGYPVTTVDYDVHGNPIMVDMLNSSGEPNSLYWIVNGVCSRYAGRIMNTIQRADFCGVFGSRMVMQGAQDRVPATVDYTKYTINRVREVSLNQKESTRTEDTGILPTSTEYYRRRIHGNYFGIYSVVNFLGALTSDVDFSDVRTTDSDVHEQNDPDLNPAGATITATAAALAELAAHHIEGVTVSGSTVTASTVEALYKLRSVTGVEITASQLTDQTYYDWKALHHDEKKRNNGSSPNKVALASGVFLELTTEKGTGTGLYEKDWGYITGVIELDLISVQPGLGGGFVYAKNVHGLRSATGLTQTTLTDLNDDAVTRKMYSYATTDANKKEWQTSGNFVHSSQTIIDDCYNIGGRYLGTVETGAMPAHYWYIKGLVYVYDQYISAFTGSSNAYSEVVNIPLTITSASHGRMKLLNVMPNYYAYYTDFTKTHKLSPTGKVVLRDVTYQLNDPISYWEYFMLSADEKNMFVPKTYVTTDACKIGDTFYPSGYVMLPDEYEDLLEAAETKDLTPKDLTDPDVKAVIRAEEDENGDFVVVEDDGGHAVYKAFDAVFHESNNASHDTGYILTYKVDNPEQWNDWYTPKSSASPLADKIDTDEYNKEGTVKANYEDGPTYRPITPGLYGQQEYNVGNIISKKEYDDYDGIDDSHIPATGQATFKPAYIVKVDVLETTNLSGSEQRLYKGATLAEEEYSAATWSGLYNESDEEHSSVVPAYVVTSTIQLNATDYLYLGSYMTEAEKTTYYNRYKDGTDAEKLIAADIDKYIQPAYYCTEAGLYGGDYYETGHNYRGLQAFSSLSKTDRDNFAFNYDALDLLIDPTYSRAEGFKFQYDGPNYEEESDVTDPVTGNPAQYSVTTPIDYEATYKGTSLTYTYKNAEKTIHTDDVIKRDEYESLLNERYYYAPISVKQTKIGGDGEDKDDPYPYYVISKSMFVGDTPYAIGQVIDEGTYNSMSEEEQKNITILTFSTEGNYYYCREGYTIAAMGDGGTEVTGATGVEATKYNGENYYDATVSGTVSYGSDVSAGMVIDETKFKALTNNQANFVIHGLAPTETSTLYVTRNSDIDDLTTEKIITVVYEYDYVETDLGGMNIVPVTERHVLNIHLQFRSGVPTVEDIQKPDIILPGTTVSIKVPFVTPGAYEVTGGGWELFDDPNDAESHVNGIEYSPNVDPLYLYQDDYLVAYYAKTYLGKTYSNAVPVSVANYHDLKKVMDATTHHYYIDHKDVINVKKVEPKIYINDYSSSSENGLDLFKNLYDLSLVSGSGGGYTVADDKITAATGSANTALVGHNTLNSRVAAGNNLQFFLRTDIERETETVTNPDYDPLDPESSEYITRVRPWTSIASTEGSDPCFQGTFHGDGHTLSGLSNSLFGKLCGKVYNLGVTGSFTSAGVADTGDGYVENCWVNTTGSPDGSVYAVFGEPTRSGEYDQIQIVNSYCQEGKTYKTSPDTHGVATAKPQRAFYNGEVAYDLNGFYLYKRYSDKEVASGDESQSYQYYTIGEDNKLTLQPAKYYASNPALCSSGYLPDTPPTGFVVPMYVEDRFADGDFRYAAGSIPTTADERLYVDTEHDNEQYFFPIWPDDYIFFGQMLTYGHGTQDHQSVPTAVTRGDDGRLSQADDANRVYRAPAYFRSKDMGVAHFNPNAYLAQKSADGTREAYPGMTAIDFKGHYNGGYAPFGAYDKGTKTVTVGGNPVNAFYPPLLDDDGLLSIKNCDETQNLLAYAPAADANAKTYGVLNAYFAEPAYDTYYSDPAGYRLVDEAPTSSVYGHLVQSNLTATGDQLLVDKQDFNCPIAYNFTGGKRMWYQRKPDNFVDRSTGWEGISLPFTAELVTTHQKGEITHFYSGSESSANGTGAKIGHEYWLREFKDIRDEGEPAVAVANFNYPDAAGADKTYSNTFLWDYYYSESLRQDKNRDIYQEYYRHSHTHKNYPLLATATPYLIGFPSDTYYEFDLGGTFVPDNTYSPIAALDKQIISFVSNPNISINVSDDETVGVPHTYGGNNYYFKPSYMNMSLAAGTNNFAPDADGDSYDKVPDTGDATPVSAFRPYFTATAAGAKEYKGLTRSIVFTREPSQIYEEKEEDDISNTGQLIIRAEKGKILVTSTLQEAKDVLISTAAGVLIDRYTIQPGETVETPVHVSGVYIVNKKKLSVGVK